MSSPALDPNRALPGWSPRPRPERRAFAGRHVRLEPLDITHAPALHAAFSTDTTGKLWDWMSVGPFADTAAYAAWVGPASQGTDPLFFTVFDLDHPDAPAVGVMSLMRIDPGNGVVEVGSITFAPALQRRRAATEAQYLLMCHAFDDLGYRRYEWKCNALNAPSRAAALRLGFQYEGLFRNHMVIKGRNRDTTWFAITTEDWPAVRAGFEVWLAPDNFDSAGHQKKSLATCRPS